MVLGGLLVIALAGVALLAVGPASDGPTTDAVAPASIDQGLGDQSAATIDHDTLRETGRSGGLVSAGYGDPGIQATTLWRNGTTGPQDGCLPAGCLSGLATGGPWSEEIDITEAVAPGIPNRVTVKLTFEARGAQQMFVGLRADGGEIHGHEAERGTALAGPVTVEASGIAVRHDGGQVLVRLTASLTDAEAENPYTLRIDVAPAADRALPWVPTGVDLAPGDRLTLAVDPLASQASPGTPLRFPSLDVAVWGPTDVFLGTVRVENGSAQVGPFETGGELVLYTTGSIEAYRVLLPAETVDGGHGLRALATEILAGEAHRLEPGEPVDWSFSTPPGTLQLGLLLQMGPGASAHHGLEAEIVSPGGQTLVELQGAGTEARLGQGAAVDPLGTAVETFWGQASTYGLTADGYQGHAQADGAANVAIGELTRVFVR